MSTACAPCMARSALIAELAPWIAGLLDHPERRVRGLLALEDAELVAAAAPSRSKELDGFAERFDGVEATEAVERAGVRAYCRHDEAYPPQLLDLSDPPAVLYVAGRPEALAATMGGEPSVTLVGTRNPSAYGTEMARALGRGLGVAGVPVVSGLALGIDGAAHEGCLAGGGLPIAVLAGGPDRPYPRSHSDLHARVAETGAVVSEMPPGQRAYRWSFPARNRIMAALATMTIVVEAAQRSGSLITVHFAQDLGRGVGAVPGRATTRMARGSNELVKDGARVVLEAEDVLDELFGVDPERERARVAPSEPAEPALRRVLDAVEAGEGTSAIGRLARLTPAQTRAALARLEADGYVTRSLGGYERRAGR